MPILAVDCPHGVAPGDTVTVQTTEGIVFEVIVPEGVVPGVTFDVEFPDGPTVDDIDNLAQLHVDDQDRVPFATDAQISNGNRDEGDRQCVHNSELISLDTLMGDSSEQGSIMHLLATNKLLEDFVRQNASEFKGYDVAGEQRLEWTGFHQQYVELVESTIERHLADNGIQSPQLISLLSNNHLSEDHDVGCALLSKLISLSDFEVFCEMMRATAS